MSYGQVALYAGAPRAARQVGWILNKTKPGMDLPWWRVVNNEGRISIKNFVFSADDQRRLLASEGLEISDEFTFDIEKYRYHPSKKAVEKLKLDKDYREMISAKISF